MCFLYLKSISSGRSPETSANIYQTTKRHISENDVYIRHNKNLTFHNFNLDVRHKNSFETCYLIFEASMGPRDTSYYAPFYKYAG
jgi:hypothetical protein